ncbi:histidinol-phosphate transaminase [Cellulophaga sp. HaHaR_3_176]|uniref:histidinol-phosphate transaminase n=1 Tax=Cellulophaga sp. HaHaR_3_176 TaxID=1942464 RepID=UPI001C1FC9D1|nr:histidinol-phosphate transaminase [Cellulophaga sp. HaHaR_3_176]QWX85688.1 histidinol-phosphate transaminase [Cellulophaga sp. HaHaR_3_176]
MNKVDIIGLVRENVKGLSPYSSARDEYVSDGSKMVFLDANENPFENGVNRYPDPQQRSLKEVLAKQKGVNASNILFGNGSDEVLDLIFRAFCEPKKDNVITLPPTYGMYKVLSGINDIENREVLLTSDFEPDVDAILNTVDSNSKLLFLCSPNNPTANSFNSDSVQKLLNTFKGIVVIDEAYIDFSDEESWISKLSAFNNLIVTQTFSKACGMAGIRLGVCYASDEIVSVLNKIKPPYNVNELTQKRALDRILDIDRVNSEVSDILIERKLLSKALLQLKFIVKVYESDANFILAKVDDATERYHQLLKKGVVVRNRTTQPLCENTLRFTVGTKSENQRLIEVLKDIN